MTIRILIADDHPVVRDGLRAILATQPDLEVVGEATTGAEALHLSEATVKTHLLHIFQKLGVDDRTAAVTTALERGIIRIDR